MRRPSLLSFAVVIFLCLGIGIVYVVLASKSRPAVSVADIASTTDSAVVSKKEDSIASSENVSSSQGVANDAILRGKLRVSDISTKQTGVDVFVLSGFSIAGHDSWNNDSLTDSNIEYGGGAGKDKQFRIKKLDEYDKNFKVYILARGDTSYELEGTYQDVGKTTHQFTYSKRIKAGKAQVYDFSYEKGTVAESISNVYASSDPLKLDAFPKASNCDSLALKKQVLAILEKNNFDLTNVTPVGEWVVDMNKDINGRALPFGSTSVCAYAFTYEKVTPASEVFSPEVFGVLGKMAEEYKGTEVGGVTFDQSPADGPTGSSNSFPFSAVPGEIQLLNMYRQSEFIGVNFPEMYTCPCSQKFTVVLTSPIRAK
jgi:hypothetical protein